MENTVINNDVRIDGVVHTIPEFSHKILGEKFYMFQLEVKRNSGTADYIPVTISDRAFYVEDIAEGTYLTVIGSFRSYNKHLENRSKLVLSVFASELEIPEKVTDTNVITLEGTICKETKLRVTPLGSKITDILIAVNRAYGKSDYIPCIAWGRNAIYANRLPVGTKITCKGRIQSREYQKEGQGHMAYEVSLNSIQLVE
jgi:primosomal replication protein N